MLSRSFSAWVTETEDDNSEQDKGQFLAQLGDLPRILDGLDHLDHLRLSSCGFDLFFGGSSDAGDLDGQLLGQLAVAQDADAVEVLANQAAGDQGLEGPTTQVFFSSENPIALKLAGRTSVIFIHRCSQSAPLRLITTEQ